MPIKESFRAAVALGLAAVFGSMAALTLMAGALTRLVVTGKDWSQEMTAITMSGVSMMLTVGGVMVVLAIISGVLGFMLNRSGAPRRTA